MSIANEITRLQNDRRDIFDALTAQGVDVPTGAGFDDVANLITSISGGYDGLEYVYGSSESSSISEVIWHGGEIGNSFFYGPFSTLNRNVPISFPDHPTCVGNSAFVNAHLKIDWDTLGAELLAVGSNAFRINYTEDCSDQVVRLPKFDGLTHNDMSGQTSFGYTGPKAPSTYYFDTMQNIPREFFTNCGHTNLSVTFGSVGHPVTSCGLYPFHNSASAAVGTITTFTTGEYLDAVKTALENLKGSGNLTFIYKASEATTYNGTDYSAGDTIITSTP